MRRKTSCTSSWHRARAQTPSSGCGCLLEKASPAGCSCPGSPWPSMTCNRTRALRRRSPSGLATYPRRSLQLPLETDRGAIGVIEVLDRHRQGEAGVHDMELLGVFARQAALAIESSRVFADLGRALFEAAASETQGSELSAALLEHAKTAPRPRADFAELAALFQGLGRMGADERMLVPRVA